MTNHRTRDLWNYKDQLHTSSDLLEKMYCSARYNQEWYLLRARVCNAVEDIFSAEIYTERAISAHESAEDYRGRF